MHLCPSHQAMEDDPHQQARIRTHRETSAGKPHLKRRCGNCRTTLADPRLTFCEPCAREERLCQFCSASTRSPEEIAVLHLEEDYELVLDLATLAMKTYGITRMRGLFAAFRDLIGPAHVDRFLAEDAIHPMGTMAKLDKRDKRPIWMKVLGTNIFRLRRCETCVDPKRQPPSLTEATECRHLTVGVAAALCAPCAAIHQSCEVCGALLL